MGYCAECLNTIDSDRAEFKDLWELVGSRPLSQEDAKRTLELLFRISHGRILAMCGELVARHYPTPKRYPSKLQRGPLWWVFHCTGGVDIKPVLIWFSGQPRPAANGRGPVKVRGGSTHFGIEHDGTPWHWVRVDDGAWQCRGRNFDALSVEFVNACILRPDGDEFRWWAGRYKLPYEAVATSPWRGGRYWQAFDERQMVTMAKIMRLCVDAVGRERFDEARASQHSDWNQRKVDCGPLFPQAELVRAGLGEAPLEEYEWFEALTKPDGMGWDQDTELSAFELEKLFRHGVDLQEAMGGQDEVEEPPRPVDPHEATKRQQRILKDLDLYGGAIDGIYGRMTRAAVHAFQEEWNDRNPEDLIHVDGLIGPETAPRLESVRNGWPS